MSRRYRAFISYSHQDEAWASWLQRVLESYRFPKDLVGQPARHGEVPKRFRPVFRDREDFSSATDLSAEVRRTLEDSDALIIICSPAAAASRWVNEEIRVFQSLGRADDIHCVIVDGDPSSQSPDKDCFPPALRFDDIEPLAVDVRPWADGRLLAKLKLLAGMLGLRLDELRRRDLQRRHRVWAISAGTATLVALVTSVLAIIAVQARIAADRERTMSEQMATFLVNMQGQVDESDRLALRELFGNAARDWLDRLKPEDFDDAALAMLAEQQREDGKAQDARADDAEALRYFEASLATYEKLAERNPDNTEMLFELGNALYYVAVSNFEAGDYKTANTYFSRYQDIARKLVSMEPDNARWVMEMAYVQANLAVLESSKAGADIDLMLELLRDALQHAERARTMEPENKQYIEDVYEITAHLADALLRRCDLGPALEARLYGEGLMGDIARSNPGNFDDQTSWSNALMGLATVQSRVGMADKALANAEHSVRIASSQSEAEPSNTEVRWRALRKAEVAADMLAALGRTDEAWASFSVVAPSMQEILDSDSKPRPDWISSYGGVLVRMARLALRTGDNAQAEELLERATEQFQKARSASPDDYATRMRLTEMMALDWPGGPPELDVGLRQAVLDFSGGELAAEGCNEADVAARQAHARGDRDAAGRYVNYLLDRGYWEPDFIRFCTRSGYCPGAAAPHS